MRTTVYVQNISRFDFWLAHCRMPERVVLAFFTYTTLLPLLSDRPIGFKIAAYRSTQESSP
jgi:hypothetical protein